MSNLIMALAQPALIAWLLKATALLVIALAATTLLRRASAGTRHLVWLATLAGVLLLPAVSLWTPVRLAIVPSSLVPNLGPKAPLVDRNTSVAAAENASALSATTLRTPTSSRGPLIAASPAALPPNEPIVPFWTTLLVLWASVASLLLGWLAYGALSRSGAGRHRCSRSPIDSISMPCRDSFPVHSSRCHSRAAYWNRRSCFPPAPSSGQTAGVAP